MTIAITGATGQLGRIVIEGLKARLPADRIVALARSPEKAAGFGVPARAFDYADAGALASALEGVEKLLLISSNAVGARMAQHGAVIAAAKAAGVGHILYTSLLHADTSPLGLAEEHLQTEAAIRASGLAFTILRNGWYIENYAGGIAGALARGTLIGSAGEGRISGAARADYAEAAVAVLTGEGHEGRTYELAGDEAFTLAELAAELSRQAGRTIPYRDIPVDDYAAALAGTGMPEAFARMIADWDVDTVQGALFDDGHALSRLIGRPTTPLAAVVAGLLEQAAEPDSAS